MGLEHCLAVTKLERRRVEQSARSEGKYEELSSRLGVKGSTKS